MYIKNMVYIMLKCNHRNVQGEGNTHDGIHVNHYRAVLKDQKQEDNQKQQDNQK